jgi:very-short-patch-repair endonuclease
MCRGEGRGEGMNNTANARSLRKNQTLAEAALWQRLRNREFCGHKFRRQVPIGPYVVDFLCKSARLIVEVDGGQHAKQVHDDTARDTYLRSHGYQIVRFWNNEVLGNLNGVLESLTLTLSQRARVPDESRQ